jgi:hypothetical protein
LNKRSSVASISLAGRRVPESNPGTRCGRGLSDLWRITVTSAQLVISVIAILIVAAIAWNVWGNKRS